MAGVFFRPKYLASRCPRRICDASSASNEIVFDILSIFPARWVELTCRQVSHRSSSQTQFLASYLPPNLLLLVMKSNDLEVLWTYAGKSSLWL
jgi:hypothetical protein